MISAEFQPGLSKGSVERHIRLAAQKKVANLILFNSTAADGPASGTCVPDAINSISAPWLTETTLVRVRIQGFGTLLMEEAERIAREEHGSVKLAVISGA